MSLPSAEHLLDLWKPAKQDRFNDALQTYLSENEGRLPLDELCQSGGGPDPEDWAQFDISETDETEDAVVATVFVSFNESIATSCSDVNFTDPRNGILTVTISKPDGEVEVEIEQDYEGGNPENY